MSLVEERRLPSNHNPRKPITAFQAPPIDRLHGHLGLPFGDHDSQIAVTLGTGALEVFRHSVPSRTQAFVHHDPGNLQPEPFRQFFDAHGEPLKLKARNSTIELERPDTKTLPPTYQSGLNG